MMSASSSWVSGDTSGGTLCAGSDVKAAYQRDRKTKGWWGKKRTVHRKQGMMSGEEMMSGCRKKEAAMARNGCVRRIGITRFVRRVLRIQHLLFLVLMLKKSLYPAVVTILTHKPN